MNGLLVHLHPVTFGTGVEQPLFVADSAARGEAPLYNGEQYLVRPLKLSIENNAFSVEQGLGGRSLPGFGVLRVPIDDHDIDWWVDLAWDGCAVEIYFGELGAPFETYLPIVTGTTDTPTWTSQAISIPIRDQAEFYERPFPLNEYAGTGGYEGPAEIAGQKKPRMFGFPWGFEPVMINVPYLIYQLNDGPLAAVPQLEILEGGKSFGNEEPTSDVFAWAADPEPGTVAIDHARGVIALGAPPQALIHAKGYATGPSTHGLVAREVLIAAGLAADRIDTAALTAMDAEQPGVIGLYLRDAGSTSKVIDEIATSAGSWWGTSPAGLFTMRRWHWSEPAAMLTDTDLIEPLVAERVENPVWNYRLHYDHNLRPLNAAEFLESVTAANREPWRRESLVVQRKDSNILARRRLARELTNHSLLREPNPAIQAVQHQGSLLARDRVRYVAKVAGRFLQFAIGDTVRLSTRRFGHADTPRDYLVLGKGEQFHRDPEETRTTLRLWGPRAAGEAA